jgi:hypothetical protein
MLKDLVLKLKFLGVIPRSGYVEYSFRIEDSAESFRLVVLTIKDAYFRENHLKPQEAPDLCYQKLLMDLDNEAAGSRIPSRVPITDLDIAHYRDLHPTTKLHKRASRDSY